MQSAVVAPNTVRLDLPDGEFVIVRERLNMGEWRAMYETLPEGREGDRRMDGFPIRWAFTLAYLVDWSLTDLDGKPLVIRDRSRAEIASILDAIDPDLFLELANAIEAHRIRVAQARAAQKKMLTGAPASPPISPSPDGADGVMSGSVN